MHSESTPGSPEARHEVRDVHIRGVVIFGIVLSVSLGVTLLLMGKIFHYFEATQSLGPPASPFANTRAVPPQPRLQTEPRLELRELRAAQGRVLGSYGWVDATTGVVRIPIDRAMDLLAQRGLPVARASRP